MNAHKPTDRRTEQSFLLIFGVLAMGIIAAGYIYYRDYERNFRAEAERQLSAIAELKVDDLTLYRNERLADAATLYHNASFSLLVRRFLKKPEDADAQRQIQVWLGKYQVHYHYDRVFLLDAQGVTRMAVPVAPAPVAVLISQRVSEVLRSGQVALQDFYRNEFDQQVYLALLVPILDESDAGRPLGVVVLGIDPASYLYPFIKRWPTLSPTAETLLVRKEGNEVVYLNELRFQTNTALNLRAPLDRAALPAAQAALGREGIMEGIDYRGVPVVAALRTIPDSPWALVARMDAAELYAPIRERLWQVVVLIGTLIFGAGACVGLVWRRQRLRFYKEEMQAAETLRESEARFRKVFEESPLGMAMLSITDRRFIRANAAFCQMLGYAEEELKRLTFVDVTHPEYRVADMQALKKMWEGQIPQYTAEKRYLKKNGETVWATLKSSLIRGEDGKPLYSLAMIEDIGERKRGEIALAATQRRYQELFDNVAVGLLRTTPGPEGAFIDVNPAMVTMFEADNREQLMALHPSEVYLDPSQRRSVSDVLMSQGLIKGHEIMFKTLKGRPIWCRISFVKKTDANGQVYFDNTIEDITARKQAEEALALQLRIADIFLKAPDEEMFHDVLNVVLDDLHSPFGVFGYIDEDGASVIPAMTRQISDKCQVPEKTLRFPRETWGDNTWASALREKRTIYSNESSTDIPEGHVDIQRHISMPILFQGQAIGLFQVANKQTDYTEADIRTLEAIAAQVAPLLSARLRRERAQEALRKLNAELEQRVQDRTAQLEAANKELEAFSYSVSHDLRAPLRAIDGYSRILREDHAERLDGEGRRVLGVISGETQRMGQLIDDLLAFSQLGRQKLESSDTDMTALAQAVYERLAAQAPERALQLELKPLPPAHGDGAMMRVVWDNLLSNAIKFTKHRDPALIEIGSRQEDGQDVYYVKDNGVGFDMKYAHKLFGVFQRLHSTEEFEGTGVGLALIQRVIHRHGGRVWAEGKVDKGAAFYFSLPRMKEKR